GELDDATVGTAVTDAARSAGPTEKEIGKTINSGLSKGRLNPRTAPRERILGGVYENLEQAAASWTEPEPIVDNGDPPGPFPVDALPGTVREFVTALAEHTQTPVDMPAMTALSALSVAAANRVWITGGSGWVEPLVFWGLTALPPASRKSAVTAIAARPLYAIERDARDRHAEKHKGTAERLAVAVKRKEALIAKAAKAGSKRERE